MSSITTTCESGGGVLLEIPRGECLQLLASNDFGRLAVTLGPGAPVIRPVNYVFDGHSQSVVFRSAFGSKLYALLHSARAAFEIDGVDPVTRTGWSVIITGISEAVSNPAEVRHFESLGLEPFEPSEKPHWIRIRARTVSGRRVGAAAAPNG
jgi:nitroimidazol reductase NimA-like FMN-containing flavoprotein (pyridoxamine 5'-phosphate oxidase superfamily)